MFIALLFQGGLPCGGWLGPVFGLWESVGVHPRATRFSVESQRAAFGVFLGIVWGGACAAARHHAPAPAMPIPPPSL